MFITVCFVFNDMKCAVFGIEVFIALTFLCILNVSAKDEMVDLNELSNYNIKAPLILLLSKRTINAVKKLEPNNDNVEAPGISPIDPPHDQKYYSLYAALRTAQETENIDDEADSVFEKTKDVLREALRSRCNKLDRCVKKCPKKKKFTCTLTCKEIIDDYNICEKPKKKECKKPKCGKTMPPSWLLRQ